MVGAESGSSENSLSWMGEGQGEGDEESGSLVGTPCSYRLDARWCGHDGQFSLRFTVTK